MLNTQSRNDDLFKDTVVGAHGGRQPGALRDGEHTPAEPSVQHAAAQRVSRCSVLTAHGPRLDGYREALCSVAAAMAGCANGDALSALRQRNSLLPA